MVTRCNSAGPRSCADGKFGGGLQSFPGLAGRRQASRGRGAVAAGPVPRRCVHDRSVAQAVADLPPNWELPLVVQEVRLAQRLPIAVDRCRERLRRLQLALGFGNDSETFFSDAVEWPADTWQHIAVTYDGAGTVRFYRNGESLGGRTAPGRRSISPGPLPLSIGDRTGSLYSGFAGVLDQIRISRGVREFGRVRMELELERRVFVRKEPPPTAVVHVTNLQPEPLREVKLSVTMSGLPAGDFTLTDLKPGEPQSIEFPIDTSLRPDQYELRLDATLPDSAPVDDRAALRIDWSNRFRFALSRGLCQIACRLCSGVWAACPKS